LETLRISILTETLPPAALNLQPWRYLGELAQAFRAEGHEISVLTSTESRETWNGVPLVRHSNVGDYRSAPAIRQLLQTGRFDVGVCRLTAGLFLSARRRRPANRFPGRLIGIFLRPLHSGRDLVKRFLDPTMAAEIPHDRHHAALYASRLLGTWPDAPAFVDRYVFLWETDQACATSAGLPASSCAVVRHPFDPFFLDGGSPPLGPRLARLLAPVSRRVIFTGPPEGSRGIDDVIRLPHALRGAPPTQVVLLLRDGRYPEPAVTRTRIGDHELLLVRGLLSREEIKAAYQGSDVAVFPYRFVRTGLPLVALEAVATGLPVVTTRVHPIREWEGPTGLAFAEAANPRDLARAIRGVLEDATLERIERANRQWIETSPNWRSVARSFVRLSEG
jgi:glycosyltransferase involved in cell wall biosynthesis